MSLPQIKDDSTYVVKYMTLHGRSGEIHILANFFLLSLSFSLSTVN